MISQRKTGAILSYLNIIAKNIVNFLYTPFLLRYVGQSDYGLFQMTNSVMISLSLLSMGFSSAYIRFYMVYKVHNEEKKIRKLNSLYIIIFSIISVLALIIGLVLVINTNKIYGRSLSYRELELTKYLMLVMVLNVSIAFISSVFDSNITVNEKFVFQQGRQLIQTFIVPAICIPLVLLGVGVLSMVVTQLLVTVLFLILNIKYCLTKLNMRFYFHDLPFDLLKELSLFSFYIFLNQIVDLANNNAPNFILGITRGAKMVATFAIAIQIKNMFFMLSTSLSGIFVPKVNAMVNEDYGTKELTDIMIKVGRIQMSLLFFVLGGFIAIGKFFVQIWAGDENIEAYYLIILMVLPSIIPLSQNLGIEIQRAMNKHKFRSIVYLLFAVLNIAITFFGSIHYGLIGASVGYVITILLANGLLMNWYYLVKMHLDMKRYWLETVKVTVPFVITTLLMLVLQLYVNVESLSRFLAFGILYVIIYIVIYLRFIANKYEKNLLLSYIRR